MSRYNLEWVTLAIRAIYSTHYAEQHVSDETYMTLPLPCAHDGTTGIVMAFCRATAPGRPQRKLYPPFAQAQAQYPETQISWRELKPSDIGLQSSPATPLGSFSEIDVLVKNISAERYHSLKSRYNQLISQLLGERWLVSSEKNNGDQLRVATEIQRILSAIEEPILLPYYQTVDSTLMQWVKRVTSNGKHDT